MLLFSDDSEMQWHTLQVGDLLPGMLRRQSILFPDEFLVGKKGSARLVRESFWTKGGMRGETTGPVLCTFNESDERRKGLIGFYYGGGICSEVVIPRIPTNLRAASSTLLTSWNSKKCGCKRYFPDAVVNDSEETRRRKNIASFEPGRRCDGGMACAQGQGGLEFDLCLIGKVLGQQEREDSNGAGVGLDD